MIRSGTTVVPEQGDMLHGSFAVCTPTVSATFTADAGILGAHMTLKILTAGTVAFTITFGTGFKTTGTLSTGTVSAKTFMLHFVCDGTSWVEVTRTTAM